MLFAHANVKLKKTRRCLILRRHRIQFPRPEAHQLSQSEAYFFLQEGTQSRKIRFHDYDEIYKIPGLYEQVFYDRLQCVSPTKVASILQSTIKQSSENFSELRVLDLGAGNGGHSGFCAR